MGIITGNYFAESLETMHRIFELSDLKENQRRSVAMTICRIEGIVRRYGM